MAPKTPIPEDKPAVPGETDAQRQARERQNEANRRAREEAGKTDGGEGKGEDA